jgi:hypothetical protein
MKRSTTLATSEPGGLPPSAHHRMRGAGS